MSTYVDHLLDGIAATGQSYALARSERLANDAIRRQTRFLVEYHGQHPEHDMTKLAGAITFAVDAALDIIETLES